MWIVSQEVSQGEERAHQTQDMDFKPLYGESCELSFQRQEGVWPAPVRRGVASSGEGAWPTVSHSFLSPLFAYVQRTSLKSRDGDGGGEKPWLS